MYGAMKYLHALCVVLRGPNRFLYQHQPTGCSYSNRMCTRISTNELHVYHVPWCGSLAGDTHAEALHNACALILRAEESIVDGHGARAFVQAVCAHHSAHCTSVVLHARTAEIEGCHRTAATVERAELGIIDADDASAGLAAQLHVARLGWPVLGHDIARAWDACIGMRLAHALLHCDEFLCATQ